MRGVAAMDSELACLSEAGWALATMVVFLVPAAGMAAVGAVFQAWYVAALFSGLLVGYAIFVGLGYAFARLVARWRREKGSASRRPRIFPEVLVVAVMAVAAAMLIGDKTGVALALAVPLWGVPFVGVFTGGGLGEVAEKRGVGFRGALGAVWRLHGQARKTEWASAVGEKPPC